MGSRQSRAGKKKEEEKKEQELPSIWSNQGTTNSMPSGKSATITAFSPPNDSNQSTRDRAGSFDSETKQILSDEAVFSREAIFIASQFWSDNVMVLSLERRQEIGVTLYAQMFRKMPECRKIFLRGDIEQTAQRFLGMMGWLIGALHSQDATVWLQAKKLGKRHASWGICYEHYLPMLEAFHLTFQGQFAKAYTMRVKFCIENLFMNAAKIMTEKDFITLFAERVQDLQTLEFLDSLDACLAHYTGREYFERYLEQTFCAEYVSFLRAFDEFKQLGNAQQRFEKASEMYNNHFHIGSHAPIDMNTEAQRQNVAELQRSLDEYQESLKSALQVDDDTETEIITADDLAGGQQQNDADTGTAQNQQQQQPKIVTMKDDLLDNIYADVKQIIEEQAWEKFHDGIYSIKQATRTGVY